MGKRKRLRKEAMARKSARRIARYDAPAPSDKDKILHAIELEDGSIVRLRCQANIKCPYCYCED